MVPAIRLLVRQPFSGLLMDPGLCKTACVLQAFKFLKERGHVRRLVVFAPVRPCYLVWPLEVEKWKFPFKVIVLHGHKKDEFLVRSAEADVVVINYDGLPWFATALAAGRVPFGLRDAWLVLDESTKVKHTRTRRFKTLRPLLPLFGRRTILTGTPMPNGLLDLFGQLYCVDLGQRLGRYVTHYRNRWFYPSGFGGYTWLPQKGAEAEIRISMKDICLRVSDQDLGRAPPRVVSRFVDLPPKAMALYRVLEQDFVAKLEAGAVLAVNAAVLTSKLRQVANGTVIDHEGHDSEVHSAKTEAVVDLVEELSGNPLLVAYEFDNDRDQLLRALGKDTPYVGGGMSMKKTVEIMHRFNRGDLPALVCQSSAVAHGLNLQEVCHTVCWHGLTWNLEDYIQFNRRVDRTGQQRRVTVHRVVARDTVDERLVEALGRKHRDQRDFLRGLVEDIKRHHMRRKI